MKLCPHWRNAPHGCGLANHQWGCVACKDVKMEPKPTYTATLFAFDPDHEPEPVIERNDTYRYSKWLGFELTDTVAYIHTRFMARYGAYPMTIKTTGGAQLAGPIPEGK
jgi:hypothetical protein